MVGIVLTLLAVLFVICIAFYFADTPSGRGPHSDALFYIKSKELKHKSKHIN